MTAFSVVIPAHNEERVIGRSLETMLTGSRDSDAEIIVVCNGCDDRTAEIARSFGASVVVVDAPVASKSGALNAGDEVATHFPRFYVDADVEVSGSALATVAAALSAPGGPLAAAPRLAVDLAGCSWPIRAYYRVWTATPYVTDGLIGSGVYGLSEAGRRRFGRFPAIIADDLFVYSQFEASERLSVSDVEFTVHPPRRLRHLLRIQTRRRAGITEHNARFGGSGGLGGSGGSVVPGRAGGAGGDRSASTGGNQWLSLAGQVRHPGAWPALAVYLWVALDGRARGRWKARFGDLGAWEREDSSRVPPPPAGVPSAPLATEPDGLTTGAPPGRLP